MNASYDDRTHRLGRIWIWTAVFVVLMVPTAMGVYFGAWPRIGWVLKGLLGVAPIFWTVGAIEVFTYTPMLGTAGTYLAFVTGNLTNLKVPGALNAMESLGVKSGTPEGEVVSTLAVATSSIVTTVIIAAGVLLLSRLEPLLNARALQPAFANILPSLFGALAVVYVSRNAKIALAPLLFMTALFIAVPSLAGSVGVLVPVGAGISILAARILYKRGLVGAPADAAKEG